MLKSMRLCELVEDFSVYPRNRVDDQHVRSLAHAARAGAVFPPLVVDAGSGQIVDGLHRSRALRQVHGDTALVDVDARTYKTDLDRLLDAASLNAGHGKRLSPVDQVRIVCRAKDLGGADPIRLAAALSIPVERISILAARVAVGPDQERVPLTYGSEHMAGATLTADQVSAIRKMRGAQTSQLVGELLSLLQHGLVNWGDPIVVLRLRNLQAVLQMKLAEHAPDPLGE